MKIKYFYLLLAVLMLSAGVFAQQDPLDPGAADSVVIEFTALPEVGGSSFVSFSVTFRVDETINAGGGGYRWDFADFEMDSASWTTEAENIFTFIKYLWINDSMDSTNAKQVFQVTCARLGSGGLSAPLVVANYYGHVNSWADGDAITITTNSTPRRTFTTPGFVEFVPVWGGDAVVADVYPVGNGNLPLKYDLAQNYPNPFNPATKIIFDLPERAKATLDVFNVLGQKVATLVDGELPADRYEVEWDASNVASGIYFYRLSADEFVMTKKMMLLK